MNVRKRTFSIFLVFVLILSFFALPKVKTVHAGTLGGAIGLITGAAAFPHVPTGDTVGDIVMTTLRLAAKEVAQSMIEQMVKDTVSWINTGFHNGPGYVTNPAAYFSSIANGAVGEYIQGSDLRALCSPFYNQIRDSLKINFSLGQNVTHTAPIYSCTLTGVLGNLQGFYKGFNGGWDSWFQVTQNSSNNPYGAYLQAQVSTQQYVQGKLKTLQNEYDINQGFLSFKDDKGSITTPGTLIQKQIASVAGSGFDQLTNAKEFDDLISAFMGQLLKHTIFPQSQNEGLLTGTAVTYSGSANSSSGSSLGTVSCQAGGTNSVIGDNVTWSATAIVSTNNITQYIWTGDQVTASTTDDATIQFAYTTDGIKKMSVQASTSEVVIDPATGAQSLINHKLIPASGTVSCGGSYLVAKYPPLKLMDCRPDTLTTKAGQAVTWTATVSGGSGVLSGAAFEGGQGYFPGCSSGDGIFCSIWYPGIYKPQPALPIWQYYNKDHKAEGFTFYTAVTNPDKTITLTAKRVYYGNVEGHTGVQPGESEDTTFTLFDNDNNVQAINKASCGSVSISP